MRVTVFGGAQPQPGDPAYLQAQTLGARLAERGHTVLTGGYIGTMEAVSRGAAEMGGRVIGVTCEEIERWRKIGANSWVGEEWRCATLEERLTRLIDNCDAAIALPGGVGTLVEIVIMWNRLIIEAISPRPLILLGEGWQTVFCSFLAEQGRYVKESDRSWLRYAADVDSTLRLIEQPNSNRAASAARLE